MQILVTEIERKMEKICIFDRNRNDIPVKRRNLLSDGYYPPQLPRILLALRGREHRTHYSAGHRRALDQRRRKKRGEVAPRVRPVNSRLVTEMISSIDH